MIRSIFSRALALVIVAALSVSAQFPVISTPPMLDPSINQNDQTYYLGYRGADYNKPWAKYFNNTLPALQPQFVAGLAKSPVPASQGLSFNDAPAALNRPGYLPLENGYTTLADGTLLLATQTYVPSSFTGNQYDWWFSWHINDTTKYKLWHPTAHQYADIQASSIAGKTRDMTYRERYWNVTSLVDEYIGSTAFKLSIGFYDPRIRGFSLDNPATGVETIVTAFIQVFFYVDADATGKARRGAGPFDVMLTHQVRKRPDGKGKEIRSRFWFGPGLVTAMRIVMDPLQLAKDLSTHCAREMAHLSTFLPQIYEEYKNDFIVITS